MKVATPWALVVAVPPPEMAEEPAPWPKVTTWPETGFPFSSSMVAVIVVVDDPSSGTEVGEAIKVDVRAEAAPGTKSTWAVWSPVTPDTEGV